MVTTAQRAAGRDERIEEWLEGHGAQFEFMPDLPIDKIDKEASHRNQARVSGRPLLEEFVQTFTSAMENNDRFPPIIVFEHNKKYIAIDGNHRIESAIRAKYTTFPAYVVTNPTPTRTAALTYEANTKHGIPTAPEERVIQAMFLVDNGMSQTAAARMLGIPRQKLVTAINRRRTRERLEKMRIPRLERISNTALERLTTIRLDNVLAETAKLVADAGLNADETGDLTKRINEITSGEKEQIKLVEEERDRRRAQIEATLSGLFSLPMPVQRLAKALGAVVALPPDAYKEADTMIPDNDYRELLIQRASLGADRLTEIARLLRG